MLLWRIWRLARTKRGGSAQAGTTSCSIMLFPVNRRVISLAVLDWARRRQCARINFLKDGDANAKFFHTKVNVVGEGILCKELQTTKGGSPTMMGRKA
jgi:hypothetical protein